MKKFLILGLILIFLPVISAAETINGLDVEWDSSADYTLSWTNPAITKGDYVIKVIDFNWKGDAVVSVTRNGETQKGVVSQGENSIFNFTKNTMYFQGVKIYPTAISNFSLPTNLGTYPCCPAAQVTVSISKAITQKKPVLELVLTPNWDGRSGISSPMNIEIKNTGDADFSEGNVSVNITGLQIADQKELSDFALTYNPKKGIVSRRWSIPLLADNSYSFNLSVKPPLPPDPNKSTYTIKVDSFFKDNSGNVYPASASATVSVNPTTEITKRITASTILPEKTYGERQADTGFLPKFFGLGKITVVNLYVKNRQSYPVKSLVLNDTIMEGFRLDNTTSPTPGFKLMDTNTKLQWVFDLNASETKEFRYEMNAQKTGSFTAPAAVAQWNEWGAPKTKSSDQPATRVYGVFVVVSKKTDKLAFNLKERLNVTTVLENIGDFPVGINVTDILPENAAFISGNTSYSGFLYPKESVSLAYTLSEDKPGELELPSPQVTFWRKEYEGSYGFIPAKNVTAIEPSIVLPANATSLSQNITSTPAETPLPKSLLEIIGTKAPWLEGAIPIIMLFIAIILMLLLHVINRKP
ncbi:MAG: hypothetical protein PHU34_04485 [Candidatus Methanoperedens sp.]|nr:hypothetical protein [Candidatus Methanoperedens sp.]